MLSLVQTGPVILEKKIFFISSIFRYFVIIPPWKIHLNSLYPRMICAKFGWNWPSASGEEDENVKSLQTDGRTVRRRISEKLNWAKSNLNLFFSGATGLISTITHHWFRGIQIFAIKGPCPFQKGSENISTTFLNFHLQNKWAFVKSILG